jgi:hypothetical protein
LPLEFLCAKAQILARRRRKLFCRFDANQSSAPPLGFCWQFPEFRSELSMMDIVMVALAVGFFAASIAYVYACEQL